MKWSTVIVATAAAVWFAAPVQALGSSGVESLRCLGTGVGLEQRETPPAGFQAKLIFANPKGEYYAGVHVRIRQGKRERSLVCSGPWLFLKGEPGRYEVRARVGEARAEKTIVLPRKGMATYLFHLRPSRTR